MPKGLSKSETAFNQYMATVGGKVSAIFSLKPDDHGASMSFMSLSDVVCLTCWMSRNVRWTFGKRDKELIKTHQYLGHEISFEPAKSI